MSPNPEPSEHERSLAGLAHTANVVLPVFGPLSFYFAYRKKSRHIAYHAIEATLFLPLTLGTTLVVVKLGADLLGRWVGSGPPEVAWFSFIALTVFAIGSVLATLLWQIYLVVSAFTGRRVRTWVVTPLSEWLTRSTKISDLS